MSMTISVDPSGLSQEQREAITSFILAFPGKACAGTCGNKPHTVDLEVRVDTSKAVAAVDALAAHTHAAGLPGAVTQALDPEIAQLVKEDGEFQASVAFGGPQPDAMAAVAFGGAQSPLPPGAVAAPSTAVAVPFSTAPAATTVTTSAATLSAPVPNASTDPSAGAPTALGAASMTPANGVEVDKDGLPWDGRIHTESKAKNADGRWRNKRNLDAALKAQVEAELRQVMSAAPIPPAPGVAPSPAQPVAPVTIPTAGLASSAAIAPVPPSVPVPPVAPVPPAPPPAPVPVAGAAPSMPAAPSAAPAGEVPQDARQQFVGLVGRASAAIQGQKVTPAEVNQICADSGIPALPLLANRLDLVATVASRIDALIAARSQ